MGLDGSQVSLLDSCISVPRCRICGARSTGVHYGVVSCEGCKAFYKRGIKNAIKYICYFGSQCPVTSRTRGRCKACRFRRCEEEGMTVQAMRQSRKRRTPTKETVREAENIPSPESILIRNPENNQVCAKALSLQPGGFDKKVDDTALHGLVYENAPRITTCAVTATTNSAADANIPSERLWLKELREIRRSMDEQEQPPLHSETSPTSSDTSIIRWSGLNCTAPVSDDISSLSDSAFQGILSATVHPININYFTGCSRPTMFPAFNLDELLLSGCVIRPEYMMTYANTMCERNSMLKVSVTAIQKAISTTMCELVERYQCRRETAQVLHRTSPEFNETIRAEIAYWATILKKFSFDIPGFADLNDEYQQILLSERHVMFWAFFHSEFLSNEQRKQLIVFLHKKNVAMAYYFDWVCEEDYVDFVVEISVRLRALQLNIIEKFLLFVVLLFDPETASVEDKTFLAIIHKHYMDVLMYITAHRIGDKNIMSKIEQLWPALRLFQEVIKRYILKVDSSEMPMKLKNGKRFCDTMPSGEQLREWCDLELRSPLST